MTHIIVGLIALIAGLVFCFRGFQLMRIILPIWGAFSGFALGAGLFSELLGEGLLGTASGWIAGVLTGVLFAWLSYAYYEAGVMIAMIGIGYSVTASVLVALGVDTGWVVFIGAAVIGAVFGTITLVTGLPYWLLVFGSAWAGANAIVAGVAVIVNGDYLNRFFLGRPGGFTAWIGVVATIALAIAGSSAQVKAGVEHDRNALRAQYGH